MKGYMDEDIDVDLFSLKCVFTDPTLSFTGLETFRDNLESLQPSLRHIAPGRKEEGWSCSRRIWKTNSDDVVVAKWRMVGNLQLPWRPKIDIKAEKLDFSFGEKADDVEEVGERERKGGEEGERERVSAWCPIEKRGPKRRPKTLCSSSRRSRTRRSNFFAFSSSSSSSCVVIRVVIVVCVISQIFFFSGTSFLRWSLHYYSRTKHAKHAHTTCNHREKDSTITIILLLVVVLIVVVLPHARVRFSHVGRLIVKNVLVTFAL